MLFNSFAFLLFLPITFCLYWYVFNKSLRWQNFLLLAASYFFYGWWSWKFLGLLIFSTLLDYIYGFQVASPNKKKAKYFLYLSIFNNLGILAIFKYYNFFATQIQQGFVMFNIHTNLVLINVLLPLGISFYTFHGMSYIFDVYGGKQKPVSNFIDYAVFVSFFPLLVAGPIERANHLLPQVRKNRVFNYTQAVEGCHLILWGMFKKIVIADSLAIIVDETFLNYQYHNASYLIVSSIAFSIQIYADFSGYSDIAIGTAKLFGFELLSNFKFPYFSRDIAEFWRRWHISLSSWFKDYLYIPLGGSKVGKQKVIRNIFIIFLVSGFWHGASWTFIVWGFIHAFGFLPVILLNRNRINISDVVAQHRRLPNLKELRQMVFTFAFVTIAWIFFRADNITIAIRYIKRIIINTVEFPSQYLHIPHFRLEFAYIIIPILIDWRFRRNERILKHLNKKVPRFLINILIISCIIYKFFVNADIRSFIYFQF